MFGGLEVGSSHLLMRSNLPQHSTEQEAELLETCASADSVLAQPFSRHRSSPKKATVQESQQSQWTVVLSFHDVPC